MNDGDILDSIIFVFLLVLFGGEYIIFVVFVGQWLVLYFYFKDSMLGCIIEGIDFNVLLLDFMCLDVCVFGVFCDLVRFYDNFCVKQGFVFLLISDVDEVLCIVFDVIWLKNMYGKQVCGIECSIFFILFDSCIVQLWCKVKVVGYVVFVFEVLKVVKIQ